MDFLSCRFALGALVGAFCLTLPVFSFANVLDDPNYSWKLSSDGNVYRIYDPQGARASSYFDAGSSFASSSTAGDVVETMPRVPLTIDGATGEVVADVSRTLTASTLADSLSKLFAIDNPIGLTILGASTLAQFAPEIYDAFENSLSSSSPYSSHPSFSCGSSGYDLLVVSNDSASDVILGPIASSSGLPIPVSCPSGSPSGDECYYTVSSFYSDGSGPFASSCPGGSSAGTYVPPAGPTPPSNPAQWVDSNWSNDSLANFLPKILEAHPNQENSLASELADNSAPFESPTAHPYTYTPSSNSLSEPSSTSSSTDPSTGTTTQTTTTPSFKVSPGPNGGLQVTKTTTVTTQSCTSSGSCTTTNTSTDTSTPQTASPFVAPTSSIPTAPTSSVKSFALSLAIPAQSASVCPDPLSFTAFSQSFTIPLTPLCNLATDVNPYVESLGAVGAGIIIFR